MILPNVGAGDVELGLTTEFKLYQNYPNPFNPVTKISYQLKNSGPVNLTIYNPLGQQLISLVNEYQAEGKYNIDFDASSLSSGIYYYKLVANDFIAVKKMILLK